MDWTLILCALLVFIGGAAAGVLAALSCHDDAMGDIADDLPPLSPADQSRIWRGIESRMTEDERRARFESECG